MTTLEAATEAALAGRVAALSEAIALCEAVAKTYGAMSAQSALEVARRLRAQLKDEATR